jgi:uncharacterized membrane protein YbhN (UPF0104 family)
VKAAFILLAKLAVSAGLIAFVFQAFNLHGVANQIALADAAGVAIALAVALFAAPLQSLRWMVVAVENGDPLSFRRALTIVWIGHFFNQALPSSVGGDAMRMWYAYRGGMTTGAAVATVIVDRAISLLGLLVIAACGLPWLLRLMPGPTPRSAILVAIAGGIAAFLAVAALAGHPRLLPDWRAARMLLAPAALLRRVLLSPRRLLPALGSSVAASAILCAVIFQLARALGADLGIIDCLLLMPPVMLVSAVPVSVAGWGVREGAMVVALGFVGVPPAQAFAISVLFGLAVAAVSLPGAILWLTSSDAAGSLGQAARLYKDR